MADVIELLDGSVRDVGGKRDILSLVEEKLGLEVRSLIEDLFAKLEPREDSVKLECDQREGFNRVYP